MKRFTNYSEPWGEFLGVKYWPAIANPHRYAVKGGVSFFIDYWLFSCPL